MKPVPTREPLDALLARVRACQLCAAHLPLGPRPVLQAHASARILIAGQAPGRKVHASGIPFDDASGERLRAWLADGEATPADGALARREAGNAMHPMLPLFDALAQDDAATLSLDAGAGRVLMIELDPAPLQEPA